MPRATPRPVAFLQFAVLRVAVAAADAMPTRAALGLARLAGRLVWLLAPGRRRLATDNVLSAGLAPDRRAAAKLARASFESFAMLSVESLKGSALLTPETLGEHVEWDVPPETEALFKAPGQPVVLASAHLGNWELSGHLISFWKPLVAVARTLDNPYVQRFMERRNPRRRIEIVAKHSPDRLALLRPLRTGKLLGLICDQHATSGGVVVPFFGRDAKTVASPARLALATGAPVVFGVCFRTGPMKFLMSASDPIRFVPTGDREADVVALTRRISEITERFIRRHPEQYLWAHRRWRSGGGGDRKP